jgi:hypothetical protein
MNNINIEVQVKIVTHGVRDTVTIRISKEDLLELAESKVENDWFAESFSAIDNSIVLKFN